MAQLRIAIGDSGQLGPVRPGGDCESQPGYGGGYAQAKTLIALLDNAVRGSRQVGPLGPTMSDSSGYETSNNSPPVRLCVLM